MTDAIRRSAGRPLVLGVERGGRLLRLTATPESGKGITVDGQALSNGGYLGVQIQPATRSVGLVGAVPASLAALWHVTDLNLSGLGQTFSPHGVASVLHEDTSAKAATAAANDPGSAPRPVSIIGIAGLGVDAQHQGLAALLALLIAINIVFGILNMLPMIPLDGGHVAIAAYEWIRTRQRRGLLPRRHHQALPRRLPVPGLPRPLRALRASSSTSPTRSSTPKRGRTWSSHRPCCRPAGPPGESRWAALPSATAHRSPCSR